MISNFSSLSSYGVSLSPIDRHTEFMLAEKAANGNKNARETLIRSNIRFVISEAAKYQNHGLPLEDLISEGIIGLIKAVDRFDYTRNIRLITCAVWWIRNEIFQAINKCGYTPRMADSDYKLYIKLQKIMSEISKIEDEKEQNRLLAGMTGIDKDKIRKLLESCKPAASLDNSIDSESSKSLVFLIADSKSMSPEDTAINECFKAELYKNLATLPETERTVFKMHHGIDCKKEYNYSEIGAFYGKTKQWAFLKARRAEKELSQKMDGWIA